MIPQRVKVVEVGPRDGLQNEAQPLSTEVKLRFIDQLSQAGLSEIEATSFVHPRWVPQLADAEEVARQLRPRPGLVYTALVPNLRGLERALACGIRRVAVFTAASEAFAQKNTNRSIQESLDDFALVITRARQAGISVRGYVSTAFVCPYQGDIAPDEVRRVTLQLLEMGCDEVSLGDTVGQAGPTEVERLLQLLLADVPPDKLALHLHDTCGTALANALVGLQHGLSTFDASAGGLGGCPYAPGASGNLATEDLLYMLERMGIYTGVDRTQVMLAASELSRALGRPLLSHQMLRVKP